MEKARQDASSVMAFRGELGVEKRVWDGTCVGLTIVWAHETGHQDYHILTGTLLMLLVLHLSIIYGTRLSHPADLSYPARLGTMKRRESIMTRSRIINTRLTLS